MQDLHIKIKKIPLPEGIKGALTPGKDNLYFIGINENESPEQQTAAFLHEMLHIYHNDTQDSRTAAEIEQERQRELISILKLMTAEQ